MVPFRSMLLFLLLAVSVSAADTHGGIDPEALIERVLAVDGEQRLEVRDVVFDAEYVEREADGEAYKDKVRFLKKVYVRYDEDTALFREDFLRYYKDGELKSEEDLRSEARDRKEKKRKRGGRDISVNMLKPFMPANRARYNIRYIGLAGGEVDGYVCHRFRVTAQEEIDSLINGDFYFEAASFHLVRVDFSPARLVKKTMFKLKELNLSIMYGPTRDGFWLPQQFDIQGKGKAALFIGVEFAGTEYYRNPEINVGLADSIFVEVEDD